ncbi:MAG: polar amino acid transport system permease protein [Frankiaceae bacterium]|nr:polar amino acid transport system permease protein [Frankiaceae bacterium]
MTGTAEEQRASDLPVVPVRHPGRWIGAAVVLVLLAMFVHWLVATDGLHWDVVRKYLFDPSIEHAAWHTVELTVLAMVIGIVLGVVLAVMRLSPNPIMSGAAWAYVWFFRGTPVLVQVLFWFNLPAVMKSLSLGVPFGPSWFHTDPKTLITQFGAAVLGLGLNEAAYMSEIARAGILSVDDGQTEAAQALGMTRLQTMQRVVLPQAMRVIIPPTGNETISMLKTTSIVLVIGYLELTATAQVIGARTFLVIPLYLTVSIWYIAMTSVLYVGQYYLERYFARGSIRALPPTPLQRIRMLGSRNPV